MKIGRDEVLHVAGLAEIRVAEEDLPALVSQLDRIVGYVAQLGEVPVAEGERNEPFVPGPLVAPLREDAVRPAPIARTPGEIAPDFRAGLFVVPRVAGMEDA